MSEINPNPAVAFTIHFQHGAAMLWRFGQPWDQGRMADAIGILSAREGLRPPQFDMPDTVKQSVDDIQRAHDCLCEDDDLP